MGRPDILAAMVGSVLAHRLLALLGRWYVHHYGRSGVRSQIFGWLLGRQTSRLLKWSENLNFVSELKAKFRGKISFTMWQNSYNFQRSVWGITQGLHGGASHDSMSQIRAALNWSQWALSWTYELSHKQSKLTIYRLSERCFRQQTIIRDLHYIIIRNDYCTNARPPETLDANTSQRRGLIKFNISQILASKKASIT